MCRSPKGREMEIESSKSPDFVRPSAAEIKIAFQILKPWRWLTNPVFRGMDRIPSDRPLLFVGNHTLYGLLDVPLLFRELYTKHGIFLRALGDHGHFKIPYWRDLLQTFGVVDGTREHCSQLMRDGESILVFPGGGREVAKRKGEKYKLLWKNRTGFARMALEHDCTIVPFAAIGVEDALDIVFDTDQLMKTPARHLVEKFGIRESVIPPIVKGWGPTPLPRAERLYFEILDPLTVDKFKGRSVEEAAQELRDQTRTAVENGIERLLAFQASDPERRRWKAMLRRLNQRDTR
jgi:1-acyl-sn-glycerol-3-phosphate acyltransferase